MNVRLVRFLAAVALLLATTATMAFARDVPLTATFLHSTGSPGVWGDDINGNSYPNGYVVSGNPVPVSCYFGVAGKNVVLVTYHSGRTLTFNFDPTQASTWGDAGAGLEQSFTAEVDFYAPLKATYLRMTPGESKSIAGDLEFHFGIAPETYELHYNALVVTRSTLDTWQISSAGGSSTATLSIIRRRGGQSFGTVNMPIQFTVLK
jgi:hypothetical protein